MAEAAATQFTIGTEASCSDGSCGEVSRVVVDPIAKAVTHLVVEPTHRQGLGRLVPLDLVEVVDGEVQIRCTQAEFDKLDAAEETEFLPGANSYGVYGGYDPDHVLYHPYYGLGMGGMGTGMALGMGMGDMGEGSVGGLGLGSLGLGNTSQPVTSDTLPAGEVAVRRGQRVQATDGEIGKVQGLVIDPRNRHVTHVLLEEGHLWGRKEVAIPISAVVSVKDGIMLNIAKEDVENLEPVDVDHPNS
jgi:sporulation protein YlmC with PRC-barrel domain